jgi:glycerol-3-phosphate dehydrogenase subunit B
VTRSVVVVGAGIAGVAAVWGARQAGHEVTLVGTGAGASSLGSGAVDDVPWETLVRASRVLEREIPAQPLPAPVAAFAGDLALWSFPEARPCLLATVAGLIRPARGADRALLDLGALPGRLVIVPRAPRPDWDADALAAGLAEEPIARANDLRFEAVDVPVIRFDDERRIAGGDLAARHDDGARLAWLAARLREEIARFEGVGGVLLGPFLGAVEARAAELSERAGVRVGEALVGVGSAAGLRFEAARDRLIERLGVRWLRARAVRASRADGKILLSLSAGDAPLVADVLVLAVGGLTGGGVRYAPAEREAGADLPPRGATPFELSLQVEVDHPPGIVSSLHGPELDLVAWPYRGEMGALEAAGVRCDGVRVAEGIHAAGDVIAGRPRTVLEAVASGIRAGAASEASRESAGPQRFSRRVFSRS